MLAVALLIAAGVPVAAGQSATVEAAMTSAIAMGCFLHASGLSPIVPSRGKELAASGLASVASPPVDVLEDVRSRTPAAWGKADYARVAWPGGSAWVVGFEHGECLVDATDVNGSKLSSAVRGQFETPGVPWKRLPAGAAPDRYGLAVTPPGKAAIAIVANVVGIEVPPNGRREVITFESKPNK